MGKTIAEALFEKGWNKGFKLGFKEAERAATITGLRSLVLNYLHMIRGEVPPETTAMVKSTRSIKKLNNWLERIAARTKIEELGIG